MTAGACYLFPFNYFVFFSFFVCLLFHHSCYWKYFVCVCVPKSLKVTMPALFLFPAYFIFHLANHL